VVHVIHVRNVAQLEDVDRFMKPNWYVANKPITTLLNILDDCDKLYMLSLGQELRMQALANELHFLSLEDDELREMLDYARNNPDIVEIWLSA
jgi:hypothetical protein